ncbi:MAG: serine/threonine protein kinase [Polyangiaceae bacterium]|nr:serine/threonine protein kinase [Polyangiaceae bacterium]
MGFKRGDVIDDRYEVQGTLGEGAQGAVYLATDLLLGSRVAIKCLHPDVASEPGFKTRFLREARSMGALSGTSAAQVFGFGKTDGGGMYIVMELVEGVDLERYLRDIEAKGGRIAVARLRELIEPIVATLEAAHTLGIVHRDLKPGNIMVLGTVGRGPVRLLDFGLAKDLKADPLTLEGVVAGSPSYIAPEVWRGKPDSLDHRIDVYSLGAILFRALAGVPPFDSRRPLFEFILAVTQGDRPSLRAHRPGLPDRIDAWVQRALAVKPDARFQSARELWDAFLTSAE